jgi:hypothetical protein
MKRASSGNGQDGIGIALDLGLSSFIETAKKSNSIEDSPNISIDNVLKKSLELSQNKYIEQPQFESILQELAAKEKWNELSKACELELSNDEKNIEAKLLWIKAQYKCKSIPIPILASSLDSVSLLVEASDSLGKDNLKKLCADLLHEVSLVLKCEDDKELAEVLSSRAEKIIPSNQFIEERDPNSAKAYPNYDFVEARLRAKNEVVYQEGNIARYSYRFGLLVTCLIIACSAYYLFYSNSYSNYNLDTASEMLSVNITPALLPPNIERLTGLSQLDAVYYEIENKTEKIDNMIVQDVAQTLPIAADNRVSQSQDNNTSLSHADNNKAPPVPKLPVGNTNVNVNRALDVVDTSGPIEQGSNAYDNSYRSPLLEPEKQEDQAIELDFPPYKSNMSGKSNKQPSNKDQDLPKNLYVIVSPTRIMQEPSYWAKTRGDLEEGDRVEVLESLGKWLRIRTKKGRTGYILSQDAEKD